MKEIISAVLVVVGIWGGTRALSEFYEVVQQAALEKASRGLPSLTEMNHRLHHSKPAPAPQPTHDSQFKKRSD